MDKTVRVTVEADGLCQPEDWALFTTEKVPYQEKAKAICVGCPVRTACLSEYFWEAGVVVGGLTWKERQKMLPPASIPSIPFDRLVDSDARGGIRALMIEGNLTEEQAVSVAHNLRGRR